MSHHNVHYFVIDGVPTPEWCFGPNQNPDNVPRNGKGDKFIIKVDGEIPIELFDKMTINHEGIQEYMQTAEWLEV